jgi:hypothetical protein
MLECPKSVLEPNKRIKEYTPIIIIVIKSVKEENGIKYIKYLSIA